MCGVVVGTGIARMPGARRCMPRLWGDLRETTGIAEGDPETLFPRRRCQHQKRRRQDTHDAEASTGSNSEGEAEGQ